MRLSAAPACAMLCLAISTVIDAAGITFIQPDSNTVWQAGSTILITWSWSGSEPTSSLLNLGKYVDNTIKVIDGINMLSPDQLIEGKSNWTIPTTHTTSDQYLLVMQVGGTTYYSGKFKIVAAWEATNSTNSGSKGGDATINKAAFLLTLPAVLAAAIVQLFL